LVKSGIDFLLKEILKDEKTTGWIANDCTRLAGVMIWVTYWIVNPKVIWILKIIIAKYIEIIYLYTIRKLKDKWINIAVYKDSLKGHID